jgi:rRNA maturation RNase YbeY
MSIYFYNEDVELPSLNFEAMKKVLRSELRINRRKLGNINYIFSSDSYLLELNIKFLRHDYYTDVITFDYSEDNIVSGDIYISVDRVMNNALIFKQIFTEELVRVISHGLLHLLKFNDKEEEEIILMRKKEDAMLKKFFLN